MNMERFKDRERKDEDLAEEIDSHLAHEQDASTARGLTSPGAAEVRQSAGDTRAVVAIPVSAVDRRGMA